MVGRLFFSHKVAKQARQFLHPPHALGDLVRRDALPDRLAGQHVRVLLGAFRERCGVGEVVRERAHPRANRLHRRDERREHLIQFTGHRQRPQLVHFRCQRRHATRVRGIERREGIPPLLQVRDLSSASSSAASRKRACTTA